MIRLHETVGATVVHTGDRIRDANEAFCKLVGIESRSAAVDQSLLAVIDEADHTRLRSQLERIRDGDATTLGMELTIRGIDGDTTQVVAVNGLIDWGGMSCVRTTFVEADGMTPKSIPQGRAIASAPIGIAIADATRSDHPLIYVNDEFCALTGYDRSEVLDRNCRFLQGPKTQPTAVARMRVAIDAEDPVSVVLRNYRKDGSMFWNRVSIVPIKDEQEDVTHYLGYQEDVTEMKTIEHEKVLFETHARETDQAMLITDRDGTIEYVNPAFSRMTGYSAAEAIGENPRLLKSDEQNSSFYDDLWETITAGEVWTAELTNRTKFGELYQVTQTIVPIVDDHDEITHFAAIECDVTDEQFTEELLDVLNRVLRHNLRTSVNVIDGYAGLLEDELTDPEHLTAIRAIRNRAASMRKVTEQTNEIRDVFRRRTTPNGLSAGQIETLIEHQRTAHPAADIEYESSIDPDIEIDRGGLLELAIDELIENAVIHHDGETPWVTVTVWRTDDSNDISIAVADTGPGIPKSEWDVIASGEETPLDHSSGIGLWVAYWTVTALGGTLELADNEPRGSVITIQLPLSGRWAVGHA